VLDREGRRFTIRPEKVRVLAAGESAAAGDHVERGTIADVIYLGMVTRYVVALESGERLSAVRQNVEAATSVGSLVQGQAISVAWQGTQTYEISSAEPAIASEQEEES
jgi:putative spermidine/putrescine transport system ATP-binding protein